MSELYFHLLFGINFQNKKISKFGSAYIRKVVRE
mgnify:CR=1 FL=1